MYKRQDVQQQHRAAARRIERQGDTDHGQDAQVHAHVHGDLGHQSAADAGADEGAQQSLAAGTGEESLDDQ